MTQDWNQLTIPENGEAIEYSDGFRTPDAPILPVAHGVNDAVVTATRDVLDAAADYMGREINWLRLYAGDEAREECRDPLPSETLEALRRFRVGLIGRLAADPQDARELIETLYAETGLTAEMEPRSALEWSSSPVRTGSDINLTVFRDVTEDAAARIEYEPGATETEAFRNCLVETAVGEDSLPEEPAGYGVRPISKAGTESLLETAMEHALDRDHRSVTIVQQGDLLPASEGSFAAWAREFIADAYEDATIDEATFDSEYDGTYPDDELVIRERRTDVVCRELLTKAEEYDIVVAPALGGSYIATIAAERIGGLGMAPRAALGDGHVVVGSPQTIPTASDGVSENPVGTILSGCLLFELLGWDDTAALVRNALSRTLADGLLPRDLYRRSAHGTPVTADAFANAVVDRLRQSDRQSGAGGVRTSGDERGEIRRLIAGVYNIVFEDQLSPRDIELNQLFGEDEEADIYLPEVGLNFYYWRRWSVERRLEVLLHELAHVEEESGESDHGDEFYDRFVELTKTAHEWEPELEALFGEPIDFDLVYRQIVESVHEETIEPDVESIRSRRRTLREQFGIDVENHY